MMKDAFQEVIIEEVAGYWNSRPCNLKHSSEPVGTRAYFDEVEERKYFVEPHIPVFAQFDRWKGKRVLEIGCGIGTDTLNFARAGAEVTAVDLSEESLKLARQRANIFGFEDRIHFFQANAEELSKIVPPQPFDLVYSFGVIHHTPRPEKVVEQIRMHYVKSGTLLKIMVYHRNSTKAAGILFSEGLAGFRNPERAIAKHSEAQTGCPVTYTYTRDSARRLLKGFDIKRMEVEHIFSYQIPEYREYRYVKKWYYRVLPRPLFRWLEKNWGWHLCITAEAPEKP